MSSNSESKDNYLFKYIFTTNAEIDSLGHYCTQNTRNYFLSNFNIIGNNKEKCLWIQTFGTSCIYEQTNVCIHKHKQRHV